jgi:folate-binding protein YgfZ
MRVFPLNHVVLSLKGSPEKFLTGLTSNTLEAPHNAFLNMHGRIIATFDQIRLSDDDVWIVIAAQAKDLLLNHVERFLKINRSTLNETGMKVYYDLDNDAMLNAGDRFISQPKGRLIISANNFPPTVSLEEFTLFRVRHQCPLHTVDYQDEMILNVHEHRFTSYTKGCFLGQEMVSKVHNRAKPSWILKVCYQDELPKNLQEKMTSTILDPEQNRILGFVFLPNA